MVEASGEAARALAVGEVYAACLLDGKRRLFESEGMFAPRGVTVLARTHPYDHCNFTVTSASPQKLVDRFKQLLLGMSYEDPEARPLLDLEGLRRVGTWAHRR